MRPTYGRASLFGAMPLSFSLDHIGPLTRSVEDCAFLTQIISRSDSNDSTSVSRPKGDYLTEFESGIKGIKIGVPTTYTSGVAGFLAPVRPEVMREMEKSLTVFKAAGAEIVPLPLPDSFKICNDLANIIAGSESSSAHANWLKQRADDYGSQTRERLLTDFLVTAVDYLDALKLRKEILAEFLREVFSKVDVLHTPVVPIAVPNLAESNILNNPGFIEYLSLLGHCTRHFDYLGLPFLALPAGLTDNGMPTGFQLAAPPFEESVLFRAGRAYEREAKWSFPELIFQ